MGGRAGCPHRAGLHRAAVWSRARVGAVPLPLPSPDDADDARREEPPRALQTLEAESGLGEGNRQEPRGRAPAPGRLTSPPQAPQLRCLHLPSRRFQGPHCILTSSFIGGLLLARLWAGGARNRNMQKSVKVWPS